MRSRNLALSGSIPARSAALNASTACAASSDARAFLASAPPAVRAQGDLGSRPCGPAGLEARRSGDAGGRPRGGADGRASRPRPSTTSSSGTGDARSRAGARRPTCRGVGWNGSASPLGGPGIPPGGCREGPRRRCGPSPRQASRGATPAPRRLPSPSDNQEPQDHPHLFRQKCGPRAAPGKAARVKGARKNERGRSSPTKPRPRRPTDLTLKHGPKGRPGPSIRHGHAAQQHLFKRSGVGALSPNPPASGLPFQAK